MSFEYKRFMRDGTVEVRTGSRRDATVRRGKTIKDRKRK